jgi:signal transduction histidine kinase
MFRAIGHRQAPSFDLAGRASLREPRAGFKQTSVSEEDLHRLRQACHDARQELVLLAAMAEQLQHAANLATEHQRQVQAIARQARETAGILHAANAPASTPGQRIAVAKLLAEIVGQLAALSPTNVTCAAGRDLYLECDRTRLRRAIHNLLDNAIRAAGHDGCVEVRATGDAQAVRIEVADSGPGFGHGAPGVASVGMSVVRDWVAEVGGRIDIMEGSLGGALVRIVVPKAPPSLVTFPTAST